VTCIPFIAHGRHVHSPEVNYVKWIIDDQ
jgi:hypothetical protein